MEFQDIVWLKFIKIIEKTKKSDSLRFPLLCLIKFSDEFELELSKLSQAELQRFRAELGYFNFRAETKLSIFLCIAFLAQNSEPENQSF